ncbi:MAG: hypothetical protein ABIH46_09875 [Chloroflexota bacterium]
MGRAQTTGLGVPALPIIKLPKVLESGTISEDEMLRLVRERLDELVYNLTQPAEKVVQEQKQKHGLAELENRMSRPKAASDLEPVEAPDSIEEANALFYSRGWTDGLPIFLPTKEAVQRMLAYSDRPRDEVVSKIAPKWGKATVEKIAINAVMAGCLPEYLPVLMAAVHVMADPSFNLSVLQATTNCATPVLILNGPIAKELGVNCSFNAFGQGWRSNATIGRAVRFIMMNIGGGTPGTVDKAIQGHPGKYSFCAAENEAESPWEPYHVEKGYEPGVSTVTMSSVCGSLDFVIRSTAQEILDLAAATMATRGCNNVIYSGNPIMVLNPGHASFIAQNGYSKEDVKRFLFDNAKVPVGGLPPSEIDAVKQRRPKLNLSHANAMIPLADGWEDVVVWVVGAPGGHGIFFPTFGSPIPVTTKPVTLRDGSYATSVKDFKQA